MVRKSIVFDLLISFFIIIYIKYYKINYNMYVELSAASLSYIIYLPIVVKSWNIIGYHAIVIINYNYVDRKINYISDIIKRLGNEIILVNFDNYSFSLHYTSKLSRIYGFMLSRKAKNNDYFILSDADMVPVSKRFFSDYKSNNLIIKSLSSRGYGYGNNKGRWPMCYMIASKTIWKDILKDDIKTNDFKTLLFNVIKQQFAKGKKYFESFTYMDEVYLRDKIKSWRKFNTNVIFHARNVSNTRIYTEVWPKDFISINKDDIIDIHLPKDKSNMYNLWTSKIMPLQLFLYNYIPFGVNYIKYILSYK